MTFATSGMFSLGKASLIELWREAQLVAHCPSFCMRGIAVDGKNRPEALDMLGNVLTHQRNGMATDTDAASAHDTQVSASDSTGQPLVLSNDNTVQMVRNNVGCLVQRCHHWSPLNDLVVGFLITDRDRARCIFDAPADRHVFPWVESLARFGFIDRS
mmetsp:Transcript_79351/g.226656  ORF Transcript_79351/g.226656 Transcript_79351/m.226656 type:complete len:158 (-) Transcript_79351:24-497(-)